ncbi:MAG: hypothetical protein M0C28_21635 [Candidatus Moduliflexus flocculans]|nr:hypothetical protein [Candidatus Moduliflexus flocculans]
MKTVASELAYFLRGQAKKNLKLLIMYCFLFTMVMVYALIFRHLMLLLEEKGYSLIARIYWTITVMTPSVSATLPSTRTRAISLPPW